MIGIYVNLLDFNAQDVLSLDVPLKKRTKAIFCAQDTISLQLLFSRSPKIRPENHLDRWVPRLPDDFRINQYLNMSSAKMISNKELKIRQLGPKHAFVTFLLPAPSQRFTMFRISDAKSGKKFGIWLHSPDCGPQFSNSDQSISHDTFSPHISSPNQSRLLLLERDVLYNQEFTSVDCNDCGAILCNVKIEGRCATATFDSALSFCQLDCIDSDSAVMRSLIVDIRPLPELHEILLQSGKILSILLVGFS